LRLEADDGLGKLIKELSGSDVKFPIDSGDESDKAIQKRQAQRAFLGWCARYVRYLPGGKNPENFVLSKTGLSDGSDPKARFVKLARESLGLVDTEEDPSGEEIFNDQRRRVAEIATDDAELRSLADTISAFLAADAG
jgi:hypothetical protein